MKKKPHILIFNPDQFRADALGHLGNEASITPNLDQLVEEGVSFNNAFCQNPVCTPSRCSFMTGWYPHVRGHRTMFHMLRKDEPVLLKTLKEDGYYVWWGGKNDLIPGQYDFSEYCDVRYRSSNPKRPNLHADQSWRSTQGAKDYYSFYAGKLDKGEEDIYYDSDCDYVYGAINLIENAPQDQPLCIYLPLDYPHPPYGVEDPWFSQIDRSKIAKRYPTPANWDSKPSILKGIYDNQNLKDWEEENWTELRATYLGMCSKIDYLFGLVVESLKKAGIYDDTAIFVFSDHGDFTGDYGLVEKTQNTFEDLLVRVPFLVKAPAWIPVKPRIDSSLVELIDFYATVEDLTGIKSGHTHFGKTLVPLLTGEVTGHRDAVFSEGGRLEGENQSKELESKAGDDPTNLYWPRVSLQVNSHIQHTKAIMVRTDQHKYVKRLYELDEFYDLDKDPMELHNQINNPDYQQVIQRLKERLLQHYIETCDVVPFDADRR